MEILVDPSVPLDLFRDTPAPAVDRLRSLAGREPLILGDLVLAQGLQDLRSDVEARRVKSAYGAYPVVPLVGEATARRSASHARTIRQRGIPVRRTIDGLIAVGCIENGIALVHNDRDFHPLVSLGLVEAL